MEKILIVALVVFTAMVSKANNQIKICGNNGGRYDTLNVVVEKNTMQFTHNLGGKVAVDQPKQVRTTVLNAVDLSKLSTQVRLSASLFQSGSRYDTTEGTRYINAYIIASDRAGIKYLINVSGESQLFTQYQLLGISTSCR